MAKSAAVIFRELVGESIELRAVLATEIRDFIPQLMKGLRDRAEGIFMMKEVEYKGEIKPYYYLRAPDPVAAKMLLELAGYYPERFAEMALNVARTELALADVGLRPALKQKAIAETEAAKTNTALSSLTIITEEDFNEATSKLVEGGLAIMTRITQEEFALAGSSEAAYQKLQQVWAGRFNTLYRDMLGEEKEEDE